LFVELIRQMVRTKPLGTFAGALIVGMVVIALLAPVVAPYGPNSIHKERTLQAPSRTFFFGTDSLARDLFSRIVYGARVSLTVGIGAVALSLLLASVIGLVSGYFGGIFDAVLQRVVDAFMAFPWLLIMLTIMAVLGPGTENVILALAIGGFSGSSRVIRSAVLQVKENEYVMAAKAIECRDFFIIFRHILPNVTAPIIVMATMGLGNAILAESALSFLGFGVPAGPVLGTDAQRRRTGVHAPGPLAGRLPRPGHQPGGLRFQHAGRRPAGPSGPQTCGRDKGNHLREWGWVDRREVYCYHYSIDVITGGIMVRTQIQLTEEQARAVRKMARAEGVSVAEVIRRAIGKIMRAEKSIDEEERHKRALEIAGKFRSGKRNISRKHDVYLEEAYRR
jgi:peptide/nickel transport system permease protein